MTQKSVDYFEIKARGGENLPLNLYYFIEKGELYVSATGRLCGSESAAAISDHRLAENYCGELVIRMQKKYGPSLSLAVVGCSSGGGNIEKMVARIKEHSEKVTAWLEKQKK